jgi:very-short-patch-repair endonuclease
MCARPSIVSHRSAVREERARCMRHAMTKGEALLWSRLRSGQLGVVFRRQVPLGGKEIADFYAATARLIVEVDGGSHVGRAKADARRDGFLERFGYRVLRLDNALVLADLNAAIARVVAALERP